MAEYTRGETRKEFKNRLSKVSKGLDSGMSQEEIMKYNQKVGKDIIKDMKSEGYDFRTVSEVAVDAIKGAPGGVKKTVKKIVKTVQSPESSMGMETIGKFSKGGAVKSKKKSIDGIAIKGHTRAKRRR